MSSPIIPKHVNELIEVASPDLSPDGTTLVFVRTEVDRSVMKSGSQIMRKTLPDGDAEVFTQGPKDGRPRFSPEGKTVGFLRPDEKEKKQVWTIATDGGEARKLTDLPGGVSDFVWSPDAQQLAVVSRVDLDDREENDYPQTQVVQRIRYRGDEEGWQGNTFLQVFIVDVQGGAHRQITEGEGDFRAPAWSPDGSQIAFITNAIEERDYNRRSEAHVISVKGGESQCWSQGLSRVDALLWSPDGKRLAAVGSHDADVWDPRMAWLYILEDAKSARQITDGTYTVSSVSGGSWQGNKIVFVGDRAGESFLCKVSVDGGDVAVVAGGEHVFTALTLGGSRVVMHSNSPSSPSDLLEVDLGSGDQARVTAYNEGLLEDHPAASLEKFTFAREGTEIQVRVLFPADFDESKVYPLVLDIHGGPNGRFSDSFDITHQVLIGAGYLVLTVNPRGSSSYGPDFMKAVLCDWGGEDFLDLMAAVDVVCERSYVDKNKLGVHGYSYGGFMSSWIVGHDHRFKAAVIGAPCINLHSMYGTSDIGVSFGENQWGGSSVGDVDVLLKHSPLTYATEVQTPALLMHGETDYRCPVEQSEQFYVALKRQGKMVEFVRFPDSSHGFRKSGHPTFREEYLERMLAWLGQYV